ncbi:MAG: SDR family oxidoreductase [Rhodobacteraceae bacterium]|nr:SDR family oxidoreductase [Paracoccaceae bacterium]
MGLLEGKSVIVTGGTAGIGRACAIAMAREGAKLVVTGRSADRAEKIKPLLESGQAVYVQQDTTREDEWAKVVDTAVKRHGRIDVLVNNAGAIAIKPLDKITPEDFTRMLDANLHSVFCGMKAVWPHLVKAGGGAIINNSALMAERTLGIGMAYAPAKAAQQGLSRTAAIEGAPAGIRVNTILPGLIWSDGWIRMAGDKPEETKTNLGKSIPLGRVGEPAEVAEVVVFLASDEAKFITGTEIPIDGGKVLA